MGYPLLQTPKTKAFFGGLKADPGHALVYADATALELSVMAYYSRDVNMLKLYQKGRPKNDVYIFYGMSVPEYAEKFAALGYDRDQPAKEAISAIKKQHADIRDKVLKGIVLSAQYGAGPPKMLEGLHLGGLKHMTLADAEALHKAYWDTFPGVKKFGLALKDQWKRNGGSDNQGSWILGPRGEPITVPKPHRYWNEERQRYEKIDYTKDLGNRFVQRAGHNVHMRMLLHLNRLRLDGGLHFTPFHCDWHDSLSFMTPEKEIDQTVLAYKEASSMLDKELGWDVSISYQPKVGVTMADFLEE